MPRARVVSSLVTSGVSQAQGAGVTPEMMRLAIVANQLKEGAAASTRDTNALPFLGGAAIKDVVLPVGIKVVSHPLKKIPRGWIVTRCRGGGFFAYETAADDKTITFDNIVSQVTVDIWIY